MVCQIDEMDGHANVPVPVSTDLPMAPAVSTDDSEAAVASSTEVPMDAQQEVEDAPLEEIPSALLQQLVHKLNLEKWKVPCQPGAELEVCLTAYMKLFLAGRGEEEDCLIFRNQAMSSAFDKILNSNAVKGWSKEIQSGIYKNCMLLIQVIVHAIKVDEPAALSLIRVIFNADASFHDKHSYDLPSLFVPWSGLHEVDEDIEIESNTDKPDFVYARQFDMYTKQGSVIDFVNEFGRLGGFDLMLEKIQDAEALDMHTIATFVLPFGALAKFLTIETIQTYMKPACDIALKYMAGLKGEALKKETKVLASESNLSQTLAAIKQVNQRTHKDGEEDSHVTDDLLFSIILKLIKGESFNGVMYALNELRRLVDKVGNRWRSHNYNTYGGSNGAYNKGYSNAFESEDDLSAEVVCDWLVEHKFVEVVLLDNLHKAQYVAKLEDILKFLILQKRLTLDDLTAIWESQIGKHEVIVDNVFDLLSKLAWHFESDQLDHLFACFQDSWRGNSTKKEMLKLLEFVRKLAGDDTDGNMALKVLDVLWNLAHGPNVPQDVVEAALDAHIKILDDSHIKERDAEREKTIELCIASIRDNEWVIMSLQHIKKIAELYHSSDNKHMHMQTRSSLLDEMDKRHDMKQLLVDSLTKYVDLAAQAFAAHPGADPETFVVQETLPHNKTIEEILSFLKFLLWDGRIWFTNPHAVQLWTCLIENPSCAADREQGFEWLTNAMEQQPDLDVDAIHFMFDKKVLQQDPRTLSDNGFECFVKFFVSSNTTKHKLTITNDGRVIVLQKYPEGMDYLWTIALETPDEEIAEKAIELLQKLHSDLNAGIVSDWATHHTEVINDCLLKRQSQANFTLTRNQSIDEEEREKLLLRIERCLNLMTMYIQHFDAQHLLLRRYPKHHLAHAGSDLALNVLSNHRQISFRSNTNVPVSYLRSQMAKELGVTPERILLHVNSQSVDITESRPMSEYNITSDSTVQVAILNGDQRDNYANGAAAVYPTVEPDDAYERELPGFLVATRPDLMGKLFTLANEQSAAIQRSARQLLQLIPSDPEFSTRFRQDVESAAGASLFTPFWEKEFASESPFVRLYKTECISAELIPSTPIGMRTDTNLDQLRKSFVEHGGLNFLVALISSEAERCNAAKGLAVGDHRDAISVAVLLLYRLINWRLSEISRQQQHTKKRTTPNTLSDAMQLSVDLFDASKCLHTSLHVSWRYGKEMDINDKEKNNNGPVTERCLTLMDVLLRFDSELLNSFLKLDILRDLTKDLLLVCAGYRIRAVAQKMILSLCSHLEWYKTFWEICYGLIEDQDVMQSYKNQCTYLFTTVCSMVINKPLVGAKVKPLLDIDKLLASEVTWLKNMADKECPQEDQMLLGHHIRFCSTLVQQCPQRRSSVGADLIPDLISKFLFPASTALRALKSGDVTAVTTSAVTRPKCTDAYYRTFAYNLIIALCVGCAPNFMLVADFIEQLHLTEDDCVIEWDYEPPVSPRNDSGYVGLKNACATCYMNSVLQQLYMQPEVRQGLLAAKEVPEEEKDENILHQIQSGFAHLKYSEMQFYVPLGLWKAYRHYGEPVNTREQMDAREFFDNIVDQVDEKLKAVDSPQILSKVFGGEFADQKIIKSGCTHRYEKVEPFTTINIDIRNMSNLNEGLEQYFKGDLLEGANAYKCEECDEKRPTVKRTCIKRLPKVLLLQLKRFDYDWERGIPVKFNDYFEFPEEVNMVPYTIEGMQKKDKDEDPTTLEPQMYRLTGVLVHSGQANGGHYYSYVREANGDKWLKFDDTDVTEKQFDDISDMKNAWFGGEYSGEVWDAQFKRTMQRNRERWWNAYMLFYRRVEPNDGDDFPTAAAADSPEGQDSQDSLPDIQALNIQAETTTSPKVLRQVQEDNLRFHHTRDIFSVEYFQFVKNLCVKSSVWLSKQVAAREAQQQDGDEREEIAVRTAKLMLRFLDTMGLKTHKQIRKSLQDWPAAVHHLSWHSPSARQLLSERLATMEWLKENAICCPDSSTRYACTQMLLLTVSSSFGTMGPKAGIVYADRVIQGLLALLETCGPNWKNLTEVFRFFKEYAMLGIAQRQHLADKDVVLRLVNYCFHTHYRKFCNSDNSFLHGLVNVMVCNMDTRGVQAEELRGLEGINPLYRDDFTEGVGVRGGLPFTKSLYSALIQPGGPQKNQPSLSYLSKGLENAIDDQNFANTAVYLTWRSPSHTDLILDSILDNLYKNRNDIHFYYNLLFSLLCVNDDYANYRLQTALLGPQNSRKPGVFELAEMSRQTTVKRTYFSFKFIVRAYNHIPWSKRFFEHHQDRWNWCLGWLVRNLSMNTYNRAVMAGSNETSTSYGLDRTQSSQNLLRDLQILFPQPDSRQQAGDASDDEEYDDDDDDDCYGQADNAMEEAHFDDSDEDMAT